MKLSDLKRIPKEHREAAALIAQKFGLENVTLETVRTKPKPSRKQENAQKRAAIRAEIMYENEGR